MRFYVRASALALSVGLMSVVVTGCSSDDSSGGGNDGGMTADTSSPADAAADTAATDTGTASDTGLADTGGHDAAPFDAGCATPGTGAFGTICGGDCDCASTACLFGGQGSYCSIRCTTAQDCPKPTTSGSCNGQGYCTK